METSDFEEIGFKPEYNFKQEVQDLTNLILERATEDLGNTKLIRIEKDDSFEQIDFSIHDDQAYEEKSVFKNLDKLFDLRPKEKRRLNIRRAVKDGNQVNEVSINFNIEQWKKKDYARFRSGRKSSWDSRFPIDDKMKNQKLSQEQAVEVIKEIKKRVMEIEPK